MSTPVKRTPKKRTKTRRSHHSLTTVKTGTCEKCGAVTRPHHACPSCGTYRKRSVVNVATRAARRLRRTKKIS